MSVCPKASPIIATLLPSLNRIVLNECLAQYVVIGSLMPKLFAYGSKCWFMYLLKLSFARFFSAGVISLLKMSNTKLFGCLSGLLYVSITSLAYGCKNTFIVLSSFAVVLVLVLINSKYSGVKSLYFKFTMSTTFIPL